MTDSNKNKKELANIRRSIERGDFAEVVDAFKDTLPLDREDRCDVLRLKSLAFHGLGNTDEALQLLEAHISDVDYSIDLLHRALEYSLIISDNQKSIIYANKLISLSLIEADGYYLATAYLERAFAHFELGDFLAAQKDIEHANLAAQREGANDEDEVITWLRGIEPFSRRSVQDAIERANAKLSGIKPMNRER